MLHHVHGMGYLLAKMSLILVKPSTDVLVHACFISEDVLASSVSYQTNHSLLKPWGFPDYSTLLLGIFRLYHTFTPSLSEGNVDHVNMY